MPWLRHSCAVPLAFACDPHTKQQDLCGELLQWLRTHPGSVLLALIIEAMLINLGTGLYGCNIPGGSHLTTNDHLFSAYHCGRPGGTSDLVLLAGPFSSSVTPTKRPNFSSKEGGVGETQCAWQRHVPLHSLW